MKTKLELIAESIEDEMRIDAAIHADDLIVAVKGLVNKLEMLSKTQHAHNMECAQYLEDVRKAFELSLRNLEVWHLIK